MESEICKRNLNGEWECYPDPNFDCETECKDHGGMKDDDDDDNTIGGGNSFSRFPGRLSLARSQGLNNIDGVQANNISDTQLITIYFWSGICSMMVSVFVVSIMYFLCIKPNAIKSTVYTKVRQESDIEV